MPYIKSSAKRTLDNEIDSMILVIKATYRTVRDPEIQKYVLSSCMMLGSAKLEVYFEDVIDGWILNINNAGLKASDIPNNLKALYLNQVFLKSAFKNLIIMDTNESEYIDLISRNLGHNIFNLTRLNERLPLLESRKVYEKKKYPSPDNIKALFKRIGINNMLNELNRDARADIQRLIESYNDLRSEIAHSGIPVGINDKDVINKLTLLKKVAFHIDRVFLRHITQHNIKNTWPV